MDIFFDWVISAFACYGAMMLMFQVAELIGWIDWK